MKKFKLCFKTEDYEMKSVIDYIFIILDKSRGYWGVKFSTDNRDVKYGSVICVNSGNEYDNHYFERTFWSWCFYHKHPSWNKNCKPRIFKFNKLTVRVPINV